jgi:transcriptional regulator with XRE-family HTH domain
MDDAALGRAVRALRHRRGWRQIDLAVRAGVARSLISQVEHGHVARFGIRSIRRLAMALGISLGWDIGRARQDLSRLLDEDHARCGELLLDVLQHHGWLVRPEASFNHYGERGRIDLLAFHPPSGYLLVVELKTVLVDVQELVGGLDVKARVGPRVAASFGWQTRYVIPMLAILATRTNRRRVAEHPGLFARLAVRGRSARAWLRRPAAVPPTGVLLMLSVPIATGGDARPTGRQRVRLTGANPRSTPSSQAPRPPSKRA